MSIQSLPYELRDLTISFIHDLEGPNVNSRRDLCSVALICKSFLDPARKHLYSRPLVQESWVSWEAAICLRRTLSDNPSLASLVRDLSGLTDWNLDLNYLQLSSLALPFQRANCSVGAAWCSDLVQLCRNLRHVEPSDSPDAIHRPIAVPQHAMSSTVYSQAQY
ncbi:hypothetical protein JCM5350_002604 [Sporobolomyces pararoseus]